MKKYNRSEIMKRAWVLVKKENMDISSALKKSWKEAKNMNGKIKMNVVGNETFTVDTETGKVSGKTYKSKDFLKDNFDAKWDAESREWTVDADKFNAELNSYADYYKKYIVEDATATATSAEKVIISKKLVNRNDGFYSYVEYSDGTHAYILVG